MRISEKKILIATTLLTLVGGPSWVFGQSLELHDLMAHVRQSHPQILQQRANVSAKTSGTRVVAAQRLPSFSIEAGARSVGDSASGAAIASMPVLTFGKLDSQMDVAKADLNVETKKLMQIENDVLENAAQVYSSYFNLTEKLRLAKVSLKEQGELLARIERRESAGYASATDKRTIEVRIVQLKGQIEELELRQRERRGELAILLDRSVSPQIEISLPKITPLNVEESVTGLRSVNPSIQTLAAQVELARKQVAEVDKSDRPTVNVVGTQPVSNAVSDQFSLGLEFKYTYGNMGVAKKEKINQYENLVVAKSNELENTFREIRKRYETAETGAKMLISAQIPTQTELVIGLERNIEAYTRQYHAGRKSLYELINTHRELTDARLKMVDLKTDYFLRSITLLSSLNQLTTMATK